MLLQGQPALQNLDIVALTGGALRPIILTADATVSDGTLEIEFLNDAIVQAIYVYPGLVSRPTFPERFASALDHTNLPKRTDHGA
jgi:hypothetical protein